MHKKQKNDRFDRPAVNGVPEAKNPELIFKKLLVLDEKQLAIVDTILDKMITGEKVDVQIIEIEDPDFYAGGGHEH